ncbi:hypothetical protein Q1695_005538 [Nippostrongylus brasiliensis]|nr:hypothetical protein Q1695_005538 [Nippostrongylus brasiliensis]
MTPRAKKTKTPRTRPDESSSYGSATSRMDAEQGIPADFILSKDLHLIGGTTCAEKLSTLVYFILCLMIGVAVGLCLYFLLENQHLPERSASNATAYNDDYD